MEAWNLWSRGLPKNWNDVKGILSHQGLLYVPKIIQSKLISCHYNDLLASYFSIEKIWEIVIRKYFWLIFCLDVEAYVNGYDVYLTSKTVCYKLYRDL